jgi:hypothetical protein
MKDYHFNRISQALLILLWVYAALSKLADFDRSRSQMLNQVFPASIAETLVWLVPASELLTASLLLFHRTYKAGLYVSLFLLLHFTLYIALVMTNIFGRVPCSCGGIISSMSWGQHLIFNLFFLALMLVAIVYPRQLDPVEGSCQPELVEGQLKFQKGGPMGKDK